MSTLNHQPNITYVGKYKGEINGEFTKAYIGIDEAGKIYESEDIVGFEFSNISWEPLSDTKLRQYEENLHFVAG